jgi:hypothetical protein
MGPAETLGRFVDGSTEGTRGLRSGVSVELNGMLRASPTGILRAELALLAERDGLEHPNSLLHQQGLPRGDR